MLTNKTVQENTQTKYNSENNTKHSKTKLSVASYDTRPGNEIGLFYNAPKPTQTDGQTDRLMVQ